MIEKLVYKFVDNIGSYNNFSDIQIEQSRYVIKLLVYEIIKFTLAIVIFSLFGYFKESVLILFIMSITKPFIGGYHENTQFKCFIDTLILLFFIIFLVKNNTLSFLSCVILNLLIIFSVYNRAPILNDEMPITKESLIIKNRKIGITNVIILSIVSISLFKFVWLSQIIVWTLLVQTMLMFNKYNPKGGEGNEN